MLKVLVRIFIVAVLISVGYFVWDKAHAEEYQEPICNLTIKTCYADCASQIPKETHLTIKGFRERHECRKFCLHLIENVNRSNTETLK